MLFERKTPAASCANRRELWRWSCPI